MIPIHFDKRKILEVCRLIHLRGSLTVIIDIRGSIGSNDILVSCKNSCSNIWSPLKRFDARPAAQYSVTHWTHTFLQLIMSETCIKLGVHGARVMIDNKEIPHYAIQVNPEKKEVSCWIESQAEKVVNLFSP